MRKLIVAALLLIVAFCVHPCAAQEVEQSEVFLDWNGTRVGLRSNQARIQTVLEEISLQTGVPITTYHPEQEVVSVEIANATLEELIERLVGNRFAVSYTQAANGTRSQVERILILGKGKAKAQQKEPLPIPLKETKIIRARDRVSVPQNYSGIGAILGKFPGKEEVWVKPLSEKTPAFEAGMRTGDRLLEVNGALVTAFKRIGDITAAIRGPAGTFVRLKFQKPDGTVEERMVLREDIERSEAQTGNTESSSTGEEQQDE